MNWKEYKEAYSKSIEILDTIDFMPYIKLCDGSDIDILREKMSNEYNYTETTNNEFMQGCLFNVIGDDELISYLINRYGSDISISQINQIKLYCKTNDIPKNQVVEDFIDNHDIHSMTLREIIEEAIKYGKNV